MPQNDTQPSNAQYLKRSLDDLSHDPGGSLSDAVQSVVTGRKTWKALKGKTEAVWPSYLEAALIKALERYRPDPSTGTKRLERFPRRNRFISDYIFETTGKRRTPKQVGSRLQQIKETCTEPCVLGLLRQQSSLPAARRIDGTSPPSPTSTAKSAPSPTTSEPEAISTSISTSPSPTCYDAPDDVLDIAVHNAFTSPRGRICLELTQETTWMRVKCEKLSPPSDIMFSICSPGSDFFKPSVPDPSSKFISTVDPRVVFTPSTAIKPTEYYCIFHVFNGDTIIHTEATLLVSEPRDNGEHCYSTQLAPQYWAKLIRCNDLSDFSVLQEVKRVAISDSLDATLISLNYTLSHYQSALAYHAAHTHSIPIAQPRPTYVSSLLGAVDEAYSWPRDVGRSYKGSEAQTSPINTVKDESYSPQSSLSYIESGDPIRLMSLTPITLLKLSSIHT
ncbi:hypothetical protein ONZ45_g1601 [Pleurotus djamor]|nr:hypothetical protein ONZ45_g1601 [Pleurotus djamor]